MEPEGWERRLLPVMLASIAEDDNCQSVVPVFDVTMMYIHVTHAGVWPALECRTKSRQEPPGALSGTGKTASIIDRLTCNL